MYWSKILPTQGLCCKLNGGSTYAVEFEVNVRRAVCFARLTARHRHVIYKRWHETTRSLT